MTQHATWEDAQRYHALAARLDGTGPRILACRGDEELLVDRTPHGLSFLSDLEIFTPAGVKAPARELRAGGGEDANAHRLELIQSVRSGTHLELVVKRAKTYQQKKGMPNRRHLRFAADQLAAIAPTFAKQPFLVDHNTYEQDKRKGTILTAEAELSDRGMSAFYMGFSVVKPEAVISVLDGTIDRFSIGWFATGPVLCSVHRTDVRGMSRCNCWPGDVVEVDGKAQIVEYEYQTAEGKELSAVNVPAVKGTQIEEYRAALAAELHIPTTRPKERTTMAFPRLAAVLGLTALAEADEDRAVTIAEGMRQRALAAEQERDAARTELGQAKTALAVSTAAGAKVRVDAAIGGAYRDGKLKWARDDAGKATPSARELRLRKIAERDGLDALTAELAEMDVIVPVGQRLSVDAAVEPDRTLHAVDPAANPYLASVAEQLGLKVEDMQKFAREKGVGL